MRIRLLAILALALSACSNQSVPANWPDGWVTTQSPPGVFTTGGPERPFQTENSLPGGAVTGPAP